MGSNRRLTDEFVVHDYDSEEGEARRETIRHAEAPDALPDLTDDRRGIGHRATSFVRSNSKAVTTSVAGLALFAVEAWRRGRRSRS